MDILGPNTHVKMQLLVGTLNWSSGVERMAVNGTFALALKQLELETWKC